MPEYQFIKVMSGDQLIEMVCVDEQGYALALAEAVMSVVDGGGVATVSQMTAAELADFR